MASTMLHKLGAHEQNGEPVLAPPFVEFYSGPCHLCRRKRNASRPVSCFEGVLQAEIWKGPALIRGLLRACEGVFPPGVRPTAPACFRLAAELACHVLALLWITALHLRIQAAVAEQRASGNASSSATIDSDLGARNRNGLVQNSMLCSPFSSRTTTTARTPAARTTPTATPTTQDVARF